MPQGERPAAAPDDPREDIRELTREQAARVGASKYGAWEQRILSMPEGSLYAAGGMVFFGDREVFEAAKVLSANGVDYSGFESRAAIISYAKNEFPAPDDDLAGYYEDFPR